MLEEPVNDIEVKQLDLLLPGEGFDGGGNSEVEAVNDAAESRRQFHVGSSRRSHTEVHHVTNTPQGGGDVMM